MRTLRNKGFTIIELIVVIVIIAVLAAIVLTNVVQYVQKSKDASAIADLQEMAKAAAIDNAQCGNWAPDVDGAIPARFSTGDKTNCPNAAVLYSGSYNWDWYSQGAYVDYQNWDGNYDPNNGGDDVNDICVFIQLIDQAGNTIHQVCLYEGSHNGDSACVDSLGETCTNY